ncbi:MAG: AAA family ATPase [Clostridiales bacterium]|nr:AAA family ATPase [Clostridiales bacterium]
MKEYDKICKTVFNAFGEIFLMEPKGKQKDVVDLPDSGHFVVLGTAGSGKTTMALLRAKHLGIKYPNACILLVTFNRALISYMKNLGLKMPTNVNIENYHHFARGYLNSRSKMNFNCIIDTNEKESLVSEILLEFRSANPQISTYNRPAEDFFSEIIFIQQQGLSELEYLTKERIGRASVNIRKENRKYFYEVYKEYMYRRRLLGKLYDWDDIASAVLDEFKIDLSSRKYMHVVLDEGQDFSPQMLRSLIAAIPQEGSFIFFGDVNQQIYGSRLSWRDAGININQSTIWRFKDNFRNSYEISAFASALTESEYWQKSEDAVLPATSRAAGPLPAVMHFDNESFEIKTVCELAQKQAISATVAIIVRDRTDVARITSLTRKAKEIKSDKIIDYSSPGVYVTTYHSAKGLEFDYVFVPLLSSDYLPSKEKVELMPNNKIEIFGDEIKYLYVAVTRAKYGLFLSYSGMPSCFIPKVKGIFNFKYMGGDSNR